MPNKTLAVIAAFLLTLIVADLFGECKTITGINEKKSNDAVKKETKKFFIETLVKVHSLIAVNCLK